MKTYKIGVWEEQGGYFFIKANSKEEAKNTAEAVLNDYGIEPPKELVENSEVTHRSLELLGQCEELGDA